MSLGKTNTRVLTGIEFDNWNSTYSTVVANSASWATDSTTDTGVRSLTATWQSTYTSFNAQSASNASVYSTVNAKSANDVSVYSTVNANSAQWASTVDTGVRALTAVWQSTYTTVNAKSANDVSVYSTVNANSAQWAVDTNTDVGVRALTAVWQSTYTSFNAQSASNESVYTTVNANSATWGTGSGTPTYEPAQYTRWSFTGNAPTSTFSIPGATSTESAAYRVTIDFLLQDPISYTINAAADTITFAEAPLAGSEIIVIEELFAALSAGSSNNWNSVYSTVCANSAFWTTSFVTVNSDTYTLQLSDKGKTITDVYNTFTTIEVPADASVLFATGDQINLIQDNKSASNYTVVSAGPSVTINSFNNSLSLGGNYAAATLIKKDTNTWYLIGNLK